jgi:hypothetical protein
MSLTVKDLKRLQQQYPDYASDACRTQLIMVEKC